MAVESAMRALFATPELAPWAQSGGLGDVSATLPPALQRLGVDVRVLVPGYAALLAAHPGARVLTQWSRPAGALAPARLLASQGAGGVPLLIIDCPEYYRREGTPYADAAGRDWPDNHLRFGLLSWVAAMLASQASPLPWLPHLLQCHDWPAGLAPAYLHFEPGTRAVTVMTVHNLAFQGIYPAKNLGVLGIPAEAFHIDGVEFHGKLSFLKAGLSYADSLTTVSSTYALEIQTAEHGCGLDGLLRSRGDRLTGILNGIDASAWNPAADPHLAARYDISRMDGKALDKLALQRELGLRVDRETPLIAFIGRMTHQKGLDLLSRIVPDVIAMPAQLAVLGRGDRDLEREFMALASRFPEACAAAIRFDEALAHRIEAGADIFVMPSRFEPCGLIQMYSLRYGTPPVVRSTGGLADTVVDATPEALAAGTANGFTFFAADAAALADALARAIRAWRDKAMWNAMQRTGMSQDFSWNRSAASYLSLFRSLVPGAQSGARASTR
jgi:starch synthase